MTLYLKYRSKTIDELDSENVRETLGNIVKSGNISHAFLFSGPKGSGKTSAARILAKVVNCENPDKKTGEPCNKCSNCISIAKGDSLDVIEIDAASHRGIDDIRTLRDAVKLSPASAKKKVYIIDEAHMLTTEASNALLKTLEEPPDHVVFILATTNPEKLIDTIRSRTVNIHFAKAKNDEIVRSLERVAKGEKIKADKNILNLIASYSGGSFRDAIKIIDEMAVQGIKFEKEAVEDYLFSKRVFDPDKFVKVLQGDDEKLAFTEIEKAISSGASIKNITASILERLRDILLAKVGVSGEDRSTFSKVELLDLLGLISRSYSEISYSVLEQIPLELAIAEWFAKKSKSPDIKPRIQESVTNPKSNKSEEKVSGKKTGQIKDMKADGGQNGNGDKVGNNAETINMSLNGLGDEVWTKILTEVRPKNTSTEALLRASKPVGFDGKTLTLGVYYRFHKEKLETQPHRNILEAVLQSVMGEDVRVICTLTEPPLRVSNNENISDQKNKNEGEISVESETVLTEGEDEEIVRVAKEIFGN